MPASVGKKRRTDDGPELASVNGHRPDGRESLAAIQADNRRKKSAASRIGRACDRCQHRKLACDPAPEGCPPCKKVNAWCTVTDPLTGTPTYRGEFEFLEKRVAKQQSDIEELLSRLRQLGHDASDCVQEETAEDIRYKAWTHVKATGDTRPWDRDERSATAARRSGPPPLTRDSTYDGRSSQERHTSVDSAKKQQSTSPALPEPLALESYVGLATSRGHAVSSRLNMFGWEIDLADFTTPDADSLDHKPDAQHPAYDRSYSSSYATIYGVQPRLSEPDLPPKAEFMHYAGAAVNVLNPYTPVLQKNRFFAMIDEVYDHPEITPTVVQKAVLHMTCATIMMHMATRNQDQQKTQLDELANRHYHYVLGLFGRLLSGDTIEHVQAMVLLCLFTRNFPRPEMCWTISSRIFMRLIELSYHRAPNRARSESSNLSIYEIEMQKRLFWIILICAVNTSGKLGRPMPLRVEDFDIEIPESIADDALTDTGHDEKLRRRPCDFKPFLELCKLTPVYMEVYSIIYTAKRSKQDYRAFVETVETRLKKWKEQWPTEYQSPSQENELDKMSSSFLSFFMAELKLLLHHPSLSMTKGGHPNHDDLRICLNVSHGMLQQVKHMQRLRALEGTWHNCSIFMLSIQTTLYGHKMLKEEMTPKMFDELKADMVAWLTIMRDMGALLGSGDKLQRIIHNQIQSGLLPLQQHLQVKAAAKPAPPAPSLPPISKQDASGPREVKVEQPPTPSSANTQATQISGNAFGSYSSTSAASSGANSSTANYQQLPSPGYPAQSYQHMQQTQYPYPEPSPTSMPASYPSSAPSIAPAYQSASGTSYGMNLNASQQLAHHSSNSVNGYSGQQQHAQQSTPHAYGNGYYPTYSQPTSDPPTSWLQYTQGIHHGTGHQHAHGQAASGAGSADYQPAAASALLQLGGAGIGLGANGRDAELGADLSGLAGSNGVGFDGVGMGGTVIQQWPLGFMGRNAFDTNRG